MVIIYDEGIGKWERATKFYFPLYPFILGRCEKRFT